MEQWALVLADSVLLVVALAGAVVTLVRLRRVGGFATALAGTACGVLVMAAIFDMLWWTQVYPDAVDAAGFATASTLNKVGVLGTFLMISIGVGLLIASTHVGRSTATEPATAHPIRQPTPYQTQQQARQQAQSAPQQAQPASGWTPPQQIQAGDWNIHSGVWSIQRGTFDGPPPDQQQPR